MAKEDVAKGDITKLAPLDEYNLIAVYLKGVRTQCLQRFLTISYYLFISRDNPLRKAVAARLAEKDLPESRVNLAFELKAREVMRLISCSRRTAFDYIRALQSINL